MKSIYGIALAGALALTLLAPAAQAGSLLGGLLTTGKDSGNSNQPLSIDSKDGKTSIGLLGSGGLSVNLPVGGSGNKIIDIPKVVSVGTDKGDLKVDLLGGGNSGVGVDVLGTGINVGLPGLGGSSGGGGTGGGGGGTGGDGGNGGPGGPGGPGGGGGHGANGGGGSFVIPDGISSRLRTLLRMLAERDYLQLSNGRAVCLNNFAIADAASWVTKKSEWSTLQQALANYSYDIYALRELLANCRNQITALNFSNMNRVIGIDIDKNGRPVLYLL